MKEKEYLVVATKEELLLPEAVVAMERGLPVIITGVGGTNIIETLSLLPRDIKLLNVGYCGSDKFPKGKAVEVSYCRLYHPNCTFREKEYHVGIGNTNTVCLTAGDFVQDGELPDNSVCDMELAYICALGFKVRAVKYVSDGLDYKEYVDSSGNKE